MAGALLVALAASLGVMLAVAVPVVVSGAPLSEVLGRMTASRASLDAWTIIAIAVGSIAVAAGAITSVVGRGHGATVSVVSFGLMLMGGATLATSIGALGIGSFAHVVAGVIGIEYAIGVVATVTPLILLAETLAYVAVTAVLPVALTAYGFLVLSYRTAPRIVGYVAMGLGGALPLYQVSNSVAFAAGAGGMASLVLAAMMKVARGTMSEPARSR